jgi:hypothetical protein
MASLQRVLLASLTLVVAFMTAHPTPARPTAQTADLTSLSDDELKTVVIRLERTRCFGSCPAYILTIHGDGRVEYVDKEKAEVKSPKQGTVDRGAVKALVSEFARAKFLSLPDYLLEKCKCQQCTDLPSAITEIVFRGETHRVKHDYGCGCAPRALFELELAIDKAAKVEQWTGDTSKRGPYGTTCFQPKDGAN